MTGYLFVCGCARSGTTAATQLLNAHPSIAVGVERYREYIFQGHELNPGDFDKDKFFSESFGHPSLYEHLRAKYDNVVYRGDKIPKLYEYFDQIARRFPKAKVVVIVRNIFDVALSYKIRAENPEDTQWPSRRNVDKAVLDWNRSLSAATHWIRRLDGFLLDYEQLFYGTDDNSELLGFLELKSHPDMDSRLKHLRMLAQKPKTDKCSRLSAIEKRFISLNADFRSYRTIVNEWYPGS